MTMRPPAEIGMSLDEVDTPALVIDLDAFERNLRRLAEQLFENWEEYRRAEAWVAPLTQTGGDPPRPVVLRQADVRLSDPFIVRTLHTLRSEGLPEALQKVADYFKERSSDPAEVVQRENQRQAVNQVSIGNCVTSLRVLGALNWGEFFERTSQVEAILRDDPAGVYGRQDFATRDSNRRAVERFSAPPQSATSAGSRIRHAPKRPDCTRSDGQPTLRLISS